jgi:hypothetical protein
MTKAIITLEDKDGEVNLRLDLGAGGFDENSVAHHLTVRLFGFATGTFLPNEIPRKWLAEIVDTLFDGAIEDSSIIEDIYRIIARKHNSGGDS